MASKHTTRKSTRARNPTSKSLEQASPETMTLSPDTTSPAQTDTKDKQPALPGCESDSTLSSLTDNGSDKESETEEESASSRVPAPKKIVKVSAPKAEPRKKKSNEKTKARDTESADDMELNSSKEAKQVPRGRSKRNRLPDSSAEPQSEAVSPVPQVSPTPKAPRDETPPPALPPNESEPKSVPANISAPAESTSEEVPEPLIDPASVSEAEKPKKHSVKIKIGPTAKLATPGLPLDQEEPFARPAKEGKKQGKRTSGYMTEGDVDEGAKRVKVGQVKEKLEVTGEAEDEASSTVTQKAREKKGVADEPQKRKEHKKEGKTPEAAEKPLEEESKAEPIKRSVSLKKKKSRQQILSEDESDENNASTPATTHSKTPGTIRAPSPSPPAARSKALPHSPGMDTPSSPKRSAESVSHKKQTPSHPSSTPAHAKPSTKATAGVTAKPKPKFRAVSKLESSSEAPAGKTPTSSPASSTPVGAKYLGKKSAVKRPAQGSGSTPVLNTPKVKAAAGNVSSLLKQTMGSLKHATADDGKRGSKGAKNHPEKERESRKGKDGRGEDWTMTPDERKQFEATGAQREAERKIRDSWNMRPVNLQETQDAWHIYCDQPPALNYKTDDDNPPPDSIATENVASSVLRNLLGF
ncbi:hypothetical protein IAR50_001532 [Cryptococcus sp. DSM 104548]